jgi:hypothetical protein
MRRFIVISVGLLIVVGLVAAVPQLAKADEGEGEPVTVLEPAPGQVISLAQNLEFFITWTRYPDVLWYQVRVYMPPDTDGTERFIEHRFNPDTDNDWRREEPHLMFNTGLLPIDAECYVVVRPYGPSERMLAEYTEDYMPTGLTMDYYVPLAPPSEPVTFTVIP